MDILSLPAQFISQEGKQEKKFNSDDVRVVVNEPLQLYILYNFFFFHSLWCCAISQGHPWSIVTHDGHG